MRGWFVTGTDTGVGKSWVSVALIRALRELGHTVGAMKPVAAGCVETAEGPRSRDALLLHSAASFPARYQQVNPYPLVSAIAPHLAARAAGLRIDIDLIAEEAEGLAAPADFLVVEGVGGWLVPLGPDLTVADMAARLRLPVILVVGLRLGCINHALLTAESILRSGLPLAGWVANLIDPKMEAVTENIREIGLRLPAPMIGLLPYLHGRHPRTAAHSLNVEPLLKETRA